MNKIVEKGVMMMLTMGMIVLAGTNCYAAEIEKSEVTAKDITISREAEYPIVDRVGINDGKMRASYGEGILHCQDPLFSKPSGYAETKTYSGVAYCLTAQVQLIDADSITYLSDNATVNNASTVSSATLLSPTKMCSFHGNHSIKNTTNSSVQYANTSITNIK